jgi:hypothetical protein
MVIYQVCVNRTQRIGGLVRRPPHVRAKQFGLYRVLERSESPVPTEARSRRGVEERRSISVKDDGMPVVAGGREAQRFVVRVRVARFVTRRATTAPIAPEIAKMLVVEEALPQPLFRCQRRPGLRRFEDVRLTERNVAYGQRCYNGSTNYHEDAPS